MPELDAKAIAELLRRVNEATGADPDIDDAVRRVFDPKGRHFYSVNWAVTSSIDAALALAEHALPSPGHALSVLKRARDFLRDNHNPGEPLGPQLARAIVAALLRALTP